MLHKTIEELSLLDKIRLSHSKIMDNSDTPEVKHADQTYQSLMEKRKLIESSSRNLETCEDTLKLALQGLEASKDDPLFNQFYSMCELWVVKQEYRYSSSNIEELWLEGASYETIQKFIHERQQICKKAFNLDTVDAVASTPLSDNTAVLAQNEEENKISDAGEKALVYVPGFQAKATALAAVTPLVHEPEKQIVTKDRTSKIAPGA